MTIQQQNLFDADAQPWELDDAAELLVAEVVLPNGPAKGLDYQVPERLRESVCPGRRVKVPLGRRNRMVTGYCVGIVNQHGESRRLKEIDSVVDRRTILSAELLQLTKWMSEYYICPWGQVLQTVVPAGVRVKAGTRLTSIYTVPDEVVLRRASIKLPVKQAAILDFLATRSGGMAKSDLAAAVGCTYAPINALYRKGLVTSRRSRVWTSTESVDAPTLEPHLKLNTDQQLAMDTILAALSLQAHKTILVHGVTGSGKTEVYIQAIQEVVSYGRQAIVLVPEISLTPQTEARFKSRFGNVAVLHSHLSDSERHRHWERIADGAVHVVIGARSAVFAPTPRLGLIVIDEEHESSFKQESAPRYHARTVARWRAEKENVPLVLGSATPDLESYQLASQGKYEMVRMPKRVFDRPMPSVSTIDLRSDAHDPRQRGAISRQLHAGILAALEDGGQIILLLNRRGFSTCVQCPSCGEVLKCPNCDISLTHHKRQHRAICHYCDYQRPIPEGCPTCGFEGLRYSGRGTQRLEDEVRARYPAYEVLRMDTDSMQRPGSHASALQRFRLGEVSILLGTQMIAKGLDFPNVTLVGVINADTAIHLPDFRAAERTFQLVTQVAGRTGRGDRGGHVLVQSFQPEHFAIAAATRHDYESFASRELDTRRPLGYPPFGKMMRLVIRGPDESAAEQSSADFARQLESAVSDRNVAVRIRGPAPAVFAKLRGEYRFSIQLQAAERESMSEVLDQAIQSWRPPAGIKWYVDVDPLDML